MTTRCSLCGNPAMVLLRTNAVDGVVCLGCLATLRERLHRVSVLKVPR